MHIVNVPVHVHGVYNTCSYACFRVLRARRISARVLKLDTRRFFAPEQWPRKERRSDLLVKFGLRAIWSRGRMCSLGEGMLEGLPDPLNPKPALPAWCECESRNPKPVLGCCASVGERAKMFCIWNGLGNSNPGEFESESAGSAMPGAGF